MSLVVWLPLKGTLDNYGVSGVTVTNNGCTINSSGKLGQCYSFAPGQYLQLNNVPFSSLNHASVSFWIYLNSTEEWLPVAGQNGNYWILATSGGTGGFYQGNASLSGKIYRDGVEGTTPLPGGAWHHYIITDVNLTSWTAMYINMYSSTSSGWNWTGRMNDFRIYDHALSLKEVKEVYSSLLIHYELDDEYVENTTNLAAHSKTSHNGFGIIDGNNLLSLPNSSSYQTGESYVARIAKASGTPSGWCSYRKGISTTSGQSYTFSFKFKMISGSDSQICGHWAGGSGHSISVSDAGDGWKYAYFTETANASSMNLGVGFTGSGALDVLITELQFEQSNHPTPFALTTRTSSIVYDNSGYKFDGIGNSITISTDTPRYRHCYVFDGTNSYIEIPAAIGPVFDGDYSMCFWIKGVSDTNTRSIYFGSDGNYGYTLNIERNQGGTLRFYNANNPDYSVSAFSLGDGEWIHVGVVKSGGTVSFYRNGALVGSTSGVGGHSSYGINYWLGRDYRAQSSGVWFSGKMSDFRLYATALTAGDVYDLCRTAASIDKNGRIHAYEFIEDGSKVKVEKVGVVSEGSIVEDDTGKTRFGKDSSVYTTEIIEW